MLPTAQATPPCIPNPVPGQTEPAGDQCPHCGWLQTQWIYNPFSRRAKATGGWMLWRTRQCNCPPPSAPTRPDPDLAALDRLLNWESRRHQTFANFSQTGWRRATAAYRFALEYSRRDPRREGLCLWGPPSAAREHLLAATLNAIRARGIPTALLTFPHALELLKEGADPEEFRPARAALRRVAHLAISGMFADPATPLELKPLHQLLDARARHQRTTHLTLHKPPEFWRTEREGGHPIQAEIALLVERLTLAPVAVPA